MKIVAQRPHEKDESKGNDRVRNEEEIIEVFEPYRRNMMLVMNGTAINACIFNANDLHQAYFSVRMDQVVDTDTLLCDTNTLNLTSICKYVLS